MNATLWIALIGQVAILLVVFIQQIFNSKNLKMQTISKCCNLTSQEV